MQVVDLKSIVDDRGALVSLEALKNVPFEFKRLYYLTKLDGSHPRGFHAHKQLKQLLICVHGSCDLILDNGFNKETIHLDSPFKGVLIESLVWREMHNFSSDCVLIVLASEHYDESDYIRSYEDFKKEVESH